MIEKDDQNYMNGEEPRKNSALDTDDEYGLPEVEFSPIEKEEPAYVEENYASQPYTAADQHDAEPEQSNSYMPIVLIMLGVVALAGIFVYFFAFDNDTPDEQITQRQEAPVFSYTEEAEEEEEYESAEEEWSSPAETPVAEGSVSSISQRTGRYYLIVGSFIDSDLASDFAARLAKEGYEAKIIEPAGTQKFYRLSVNDAESISTLQANMDSMKEKHGDNIWIVKY